VITKVYRFRFGALFALRSLWAEAETRAAAPFPAPLSPLGLGSSFLHCASHRFPLTKPNTSCTIEMPASLRSDGVRDHPGMPFGIILNLASASRSNPTAFQAVSFQVNCLRMEEWLSIGTMRTQGLT
jgi:hypothetical protein